MKTPRDLLLNRHRAAETKLDLIRRDLIFELNNKGTKEQSPEKFLVAWLLRFSKTFWDELILPSRRVWAGLAAVWVVLAVINIAQRDSLPAGNVSAAPMIMSFGEQQRLLNELFADRALPIDADRPKTGAPQPRTEFLLQQTV